MFILNNIKIMLTFVLVTIEAKEIWLMMHRLQQSLMPLKMVCFP